MTILLWTLQIALGVLFALHGAALLVSPPPLQETLESLPYPKPFLQFIGLCELLGGLGLILPWWLGIAPTLTPLAAAGLAIIMLGAVFTHLQAGETPQVVLLSTLAVLLVVVTVARWGGPALAS